MTKKQNPTQHNLEERAFKFARQAISFRKGVPKTVIDGEKLPSNWFKQRLSFNPAKESVVLDLVL
jgi:hypothetical protein